MWIAIRVLAEPGDYNTDGTVDRTDYDRWRSSYGDFAVPFFAADSNGNVLIDAADYVVWRNNLGASAAISQEIIPEPSALLQMALACACICRRGSKAHGITQTLTVV